MNIIFKASGSFSEFTKKTASQLIVSSVMASYLAVNPAMAAESGITKLPAITVSETRDDDSDSYKNSSSSLNKLTAPLKDTPKTITVIPKSLMEDQGATSLKDALRNVPGLSINSGEGGNQGDSVNIRGFTSRNDFFIDGMRDFGNYNRDPFNIESLEVLQGPASILFGRGSTGGVVNQKSKEARLGNYNKSSVALATNDTTRFTTDVNRELSDTSAFRINLMAHHNEVEDRDTVEDNRFGIAPSLSFGLGTDTRLTLDYLHQKEDNIPDYGIGFMNGRPAKVDRSNYYGFQDDYFKSEVDIATAKFEHDFNKDVSVSNKLRYANYQRQLNTTQPTYSTPFVNATRGNINVDSTETALINQTDLKVKFDTFGLRHESVSGVELSRETSAPTRFTYTGIPSTNIQNPAEAYFSYTTKTLSSKTEGSNDTLAAYFSDTLHLNQKWDILGSVRFDHLKSRFQQEQPVANAANFSQINNNISWSGGVVYKPTDNGSIYVSAGSSFQPSAETFSLQQVPQTGTARVSSNIDPETSRTYEVGTKWDFFKKKLSTSFAIFRTEKNKVRENDPNNSTSFVLVGKQVVDGFQAQVSGNLTNKWQIFSGYSYMNGRVSKSALITTPKGTVLGGTPKHTFNLFTTYKLPYNLEVGGGLNAISDRRGSTLATANKAPGYATYNAMTKYTLNENIDFQFNVENLTNTYYYDQVAGRVVPGEGRVFMLTTNFSF
ncbi:MAG: TonB-dependent siderophore receptor [Pseudomonadota bacterium]